MSGSKRWATTALGLVLTVALGACRSVGTPEQGAPAPAQEDRSATLPSAPTDRPAGLAPGGPLGHIPVKIEGIDAILHSPAAKDPVFQERVGFWVHFWTERQHGHFGRYLQRMGRYAALVDHELEARALPISLRYLPIVESGYLPGAVSRAGATGMWQIMAPTAGDLGLSVGAIVDDRRDPVASTFAALEYLEELHARFDSWFLALAAYNAGPGRVGRILEERGGDPSLSGDEQFLHIRSYLPAETREFVPRFFAAAALASNPTAFGFDSPNPAPIAFDEVTVPDATSLDVVAQAAGVPEDDILALNPHFLRGFTPAGETRVVRVPDGRGDRFAREYALIPPEDRLSFLEHVVASGETFTHIARRYGVALSDLTAMNSQIDPRRLQIGMTVVVPVASSGSGVALTAGASGGADAQGGDGGEHVHVVASGESLWTIARRYGVRAESIAQANDKRPDDLIRPGDRLRIP